MVVFKTFFHVEIRYNRIIGAENDVEYIVSVDFMQFPLSRFLYGCGIELYGGGFLGKRKDIFEIFFKKMEVL